MYNKAYLIDRKIQNPYFYRGVHSTELHVMDPNEKSHPENPVVNELTLCDCENVNNLRNWREIVPD